MKKALFCILAAALTAVAALAAPKATTLLSPNGKLTVNLETGSGSLSYTVIKDGKPVYEMRDIRLVTGTETIPDGSVKVGKTRFMYDKFQPVVPLKFSTVVDEYNETEISLGQRDGNQSGKGCHDASPRDGQCRRLPVRDGPQGRCGSV